jgi:hypothetical protein
MTKDIVRESVKNEPAYMAYVSWVESPIHYKILVVLLPVVNLFFTLLGFLVIYMQLKHWWFEFGKWVTKQFSRDPDNMRFFRIKSWIVRVFFYRWIDLFFKRYEYDIIEKVFKKIIKKQKDEKEKHKSECEENPGAHKSDQETSEQGK